MAPGFLGSSLVRRLINEGCEIVILDNASRGNTSRIEDIIAKVHYVEGDIRNQSIVN